MKRFVPIFLFTLLLSAGTLTAQETIVYDFEEGVIPEGFTLINRDMLEPNQPEDAAYADSAWNVEQSSLLESFVAVSVSWYVDDAGPADDWMILPKIEVSENSVLSWTAISATSSGDFPDSYQVLVNAGDPTFESFEENGFLLLSVDPEEWETAQMRDLSLEEYAGQEVHIAFRNVTPSGTALLVDDITITEAMLSNSRTVDNEAFRFGLTPNPAGDAGSLLSFELEQSSPVQLSIRDMAGREVQRLQLGRLSSGTHNVQLSTNELAAGTYLVSLQTAEKVGTTKLVIR